MDNKIVIYTRESCGYCIKIKEWMNNNGINYNEVPVSEIKDPILLKEIKGVPYTIITINREKHIIMGFNVAKLSEILLS